MTNHSITRVDGPHPATEQGSLEYFTAHCACAVRIESSLESLARQWGREHVEYMNRKESR